MLTDPYRTAIANAIAPLQAVGVGSAKIIGRVHMAELKIGDNLFPCTFTVLDQVRAWYSIEPLHAHS